MPTSADRANPQIRDGILLYANLPPGQANQIPLAPPLSAWFIADHNPATGYSWRFIPDSSGVYQMIRQVTLRGATGMVGVPGKMIWIFRPVRRGTGQATFALYAPGKGVPVRTDVVVMNVGYNE